MRKTSFTLAAIAALWLSLGRCQEAQPAPPEGAQAQLRQAQEQLARAEAEARRTAQLAQAQAQEQLARAEAEAQRSVQLADAQAHNLAKEARDAARAQQLLQLAQAVPPTALAPPQPPEPLALPSLVAAEGYGEAVSRDAALDAYERLGHQLHGAGPALIVSPARAEAGEVAQVEEDLAVMSRILEKAVERASGRESPRSVLGINLLNRFGSRQSQSLYLEGYGVLFVLNVGCPLLASPAKEQAKEEKLDNSTWEQTKRELFGGGQTSADYALLRVEADRTVEEYDAGKVESLKKGLVEALKNAANIRHLKRDDTIAVVVLGPPAGLPKRSEARSERPSSRRRAQAITGRPTTLAIRAKGSDVDAFAQGKLTAEEFAKKVSIAVY